jgi:hypothetical protein
LELSQPEIEQQKERVLAAAATELERLFKKEDFSRMKVVRMIYIIFFQKLDVSADWLSTCQFQCYFSMWGKCN